MNKRVLLLFLACLAPGAACAVPRTPTVEPVTYVLDYGSQHLGNEAWMQATLSAPPELLHLGKDVPMSHNWGPIAALGGENQALGKGEHIRRLSPDEVRERIAGLSDMVQRLHEGGVEMVMPYICAMTIGGHPETRTGFWEFFDHWTEYAEFGLGAPPATDPATWFQLTPEGEPHFFYRLTDGTYPPYEPNLRYAVCVNNPDWRYWLEHVVRLCAEVGYDGVFVDNAGSQRCHCAICQDGFRDFVAARYTPAELQELFDVRSAADLRLGTGLEAGLLWAESVRFWTHSLREQQLWIKAAGEQVRTPFYVFPNGGHRRPDHVKLEYAVSDYVMFEKSIGLYGTNPGTVQRRVVEDIHLTHYNTNAYECKLVQCMGGNARPIILTRGGYPATRREWAINTMSAELGMAEMAAFGNGGGFLHRPAYQLLGPSITRYREFITNNADLYRNMDSYAQVALAAFPEQNLYNNRTHMTWVEQLTTACAENSLLFDLVPEESFTVDNLQLYSLVVLAEARFMSREQVEALQEYLQAGGKAVIIGQNAVGDRQMRPYEALLLPATEGGEKQVLHRQVGSGTALVSPFMPTSDQFGGWLANLGVEHLRLCNNEGFRQVWFNAFRPLDGAADIVLHVVNYGVPLGEDETELTLREDLRVQVPLPEGRRIQSAMVYDPDVPAPVEIAPTGQTGSLNLPPLGVYQVVRIVLQ